MRPIHRPVDSNPSSVLVVPASEAEDSAASFQGPSDVSDHQRVQPMRQAKLLRIPIVDSDIATCVSQRQQQQQQQQQQ